jgi:hypothetical protein
MSTQQCKRPLEKQELTSDGSTGKSSPFAASADLLLNGSHASAGLQAAANRLRQGGGAEPDPGRHSWFVGTASNHVGSHRPGGTDWLHSEPANPRDRSADRARREPAANRAGRDPSFGASGHDRDGIGMLGAGAISSVLRNNLSSLRPADPIAYLTAIALFVLVIGLAVCAPARRAIRIQPAEALRHE